MTLYSVIFRPRAEKQLDRLFTYIASHGGKSRANRFVGRIVETCLSLATFPERGVKRASIRAGLRTISFARRVTIAFRIDHTHNVVEILGVFYGGQDFETALARDDDKATPEVSE